MAGFAQGGRIVFAADALASQFAFGFPRQVAQCVAGVGARRSSAGSVLHRSDPAVQKESALKGYRLIRTAWPPKPRLTPLRPKRLTDAPNTPKASQRASVARLEARRDEADERI
jgi:hypothetical protein